MTAFFKVLLRGIIVTVLLPLILVVWVGYGVYCLITFIVMFIKNTIVFFMGGSLNDDMKEDIESKKILLEAEQAKANQEQLINNMNNVFGAMAQQMQQFAQQNNIQPQNPTPAIENSQPETIEYTDIPSEESNVNEEGGNDDGQSY